MPDGADALTGWRDNNGRSHWRRVAVGWPGEAEAVCVSVNTDMNGRRYVVVRAQRKIASGRYAGLWESSGRGDVHTPAAYAELLAAIKRAGEIAGMA
ncbi:MAG TPA: hypothetical protein VMS45_02670 [Gemmatimonadaceae bacterium]|jgi:hypothetical protein|nr:hypothetical protein [Gemmatimonadaceae bacterium]